MSLLLFIDTETTGLPPRNWNSYDDDVWDSCRLVQIAWELWDPILFKLIDSQCHIIKPNNFTIPIESTNIHGITHEDAIQNGVHITHIWNLLNQYINSVNTIVAHNINFDNKIVISELYRSKNFDLLNLWKSKQKKCTMLMGTEKGKKWPKLADLYEKLFNEKPECRLHSADADVALCSKIYFQLIKQ